MLGAGDQGAAENMYGVIGAAMQKAALHGNTIGNAIVYEAARAITAIYPNANLLQSGGCCDADLLLPSVRQTRKPGRCYPYQGSLLQCPRPRSLCCLHSVHLSAARVRCVRCSGGDHCDLPAGSQPQPAIHGH